jgi:hypothetical protein
MSLDLMRWYYGSQDDASFLIAVAFTEYLLDTSEGVPDQFRCVLGGYGQGYGYAVRVLRLISKTIRHQKDRQDPSRYLVTA